MITRLYQVRLLRSVETDDKKWPLYRKESWQYCYQDSSGFLVLKGKHSSWLFNMNAKPGIDFVWAYGVDPRTPEEKAIARDLP